MDQYVRVLMRLRPLSETSHNDVDVLYSTRQPCQRHSELEPKLGHRNLLERE